MSCLVCLVQFLWVINEKWRLWVCFSKDLARPLEICGCVVLGWPLWLEHSMLDWIIMLPVLRLVLDHHLIQSLPDICQTGSLCGLLQKLLAHKCPITIIVTIGVHEIKHFEGPLVLESVLLSLLPKLFGRQLQLIFEGVVEELFFRFVIAQGQCLHTLVVLGVHLVFD